jgi:hypothetical protein
VSAHGLFYGPVGREDSGDYCAEDVACGGMSERRGYRSGARVVVKVLLLERECDGKVSHERQFQWR